MTENGPVLDSRERRNRSEAGQTMVLHVGGMRQEYARAGLDIADLDPDPIVQFGRWFEEALEAGGFEANAMILATVSPAGTTATLADSGLTSRFVSAGKRAGSSFFCRARNRT